MYVYNRADYFGPFTDEEANTYVQEHGGSILTTLPRNTIPIDPRASRTKLNVAPPKSQKVSQRPDSLPEGVTPLSDQERADLDVLEAKIEPHVKSFMEVGEALLQVQNDSRKLYREWGTFEDYCERRFHISRQHGYRIMKETVIQRDELSPVGYTLNGRQIRELEVLDDPLERQVATALAVRASEEANAPLTADLVKAGVRAVQEMKVTGGHVTVDEVQVKGDAPMPAAVASTINIAAQILQEKAQRASDHAKWDKLAEFMGDIASLQILLVNKMAELTAVPQIRIVIYVPKPPKETPNEASN